MTDKADDLMEEDNVVDVGSDEEELVDWEFPQLHNVDLSQCAFSISHFPLHFPLIS